MKRLLQTISILFLSIVCLAQTAVYSGQIATIYSAASPTTGTASAVFNVPGTQNNPQIGFSIGGAFSGTPGTFEFDLQESDNSTGPWVTNTNYELTTSDSNNNWRMDVVTTTRWFRLLCKTQTSNSVTLTATVARP